MKPPTFTQRVVIEVSQGDKHARYERTTEGHWPGREPEPIADVIRATAELLISDIEAAES
jgi:hypothetical protein